MEAVPSILAIVGVVWARIIDLEILVISGENYQKFTSKPYFVGEFTVSKLRYIIAI
jgi:hypothetical protein